MDGPCAFGGLVLDSECVSKGEEQDKICSCVPVGSGRDIKESTVE